MRASILQRRSHIDLPPGFDGTVADLSEAERALLMVYSTALDTAAMTTLRELYSTPRPAVQAEFDELPADADEATRQRLAENYAPVARRQFEEHPALKDVAASEALTKPVVLHGLVELYNPAQLDVLQWLNTLIEELFLRRSHAFRASRVCVRTGRLLVWIALLHGGADNEKLQNRAEHFCMPAARKKPNFLTIDEYGDGNPMAAVDALNTYTYHGDTPGMGGTPSEDDGGNSGAGDPFDTGTDDRAAKPAVSGGQGQCRPEGPGPRQSRSAWSSAGPGAAKGAFATLAVSRKALSGRPVTPTRLSQPGHCRESAFRDSEAGQQNARVTLPEPWPEGLAPTGGADTRYCDVYDADGREWLGGNGHDRRVVGYFTGWRTGEGGDPRYLVKNIPWSRVSHINYAFAHVDEGNRISVGDTADPKNPATGMTRPGVHGAEMDDSLSYRGHFNLLTRYKRQHPQVKTLISVGGWAASRNFYTMATNADGSVNQAGIDTFADSVTAFLDRYRFDGVDIDYEYPTALPDSGNPADWTPANGRRKGLQAGYNALMKTLREKLDPAGASLGRYYLLTSAASASGYLVRGYDAGQALQYQDFVNVMSYDLRRRRSDIPTR